ncbi:hypothetical protein EAG_06742 [Camponotus floridanus]|uniref:C2H2-type domain-containing protein n=1 Tax=Camponotus floridanus TaxID=104421 RepID=E2AEU6_CAMFO|nr:hypothetical protein EAG_06742 [Camponotus floridanus]
MALNRHVREECGRILYTCPYCHNIMPMKFNLLNHLKKEHEYNTCLACSKSYKWKKSLHRHVRESPECWPVLLTSGNGEFIRQIHYKMLYNTKN